MCNIAGYVGTRPAAPILLEMIRRQEGMNGGFYTGLATIHEGKVYYAKLTGDCARLEALTEAASLPGNIGIIHSRTRSGGGDEWAHPFVGIRDGEIRLAYVANGAAGCFAHRKPEQAALAEQLCREGFPMNAKVSDPENRYLALSDGTAVHMSDVMCQLILKNMTEGKPAAEAMAEAFCRMPAAIVGLALDPGAPDTIAWSRINCPMMVAFADHGAYLASGALGFPADAGTPTALPANAGGTVTKTGFTAGPYAAPPVAVDQIDGTCLRQAYDAVTEALGKERLNFAPLTRLVKQTVYPDSLCPPNDLLTYQVLWALEREGRLTREHRRVESDFPGIDAPRVFFGLK